MRRWKRVQTEAGVRFRSALELHEAALLRNLVGSVLDMLDTREPSGPVDELEAITGMRVGNTRAPQDPTLQRLLPDFHHPDGDEPDDPVGVDDLNAALRGLHEPAIIDAKRAAAQELLGTVPHAGGRIELTEEQANGWVAAINDVRLALGTMLGVGPDGPDRLPADHPMAGQLGVYQWLTVLQDYLVVALMGRRGR